METSVHYEIVLLLKIASFQWPNFDHFPFALYILWEFAVGREIIYNQSTRKMANKRGETSQDEKTNKDLERLKLEIQQENQMR